MDYWHKLDQNPAEDLTWNLPEQPSGSLTLIGGHSQSFNTEIKTAEFISRNFHLKELKIALPDILKSKLPTLEGFLFLPSTDSGSFAPSKLLTSIFSATDFNLILGDLSKNSATANAIASACLASEKPTIITRDAVDSICEINPGKLLEKSNLFIFASLVQLQKLFRALYYPRIILLSSSLLQIAETLHKFTLSYKTTLITLHDGQILVAHHGEVNSIPLEKTAYAPFSIWNGELAAKIAAFNLFNPQNPLTATTAAIFYL